MCWYHRPSHWVDHLSEIISAFWGSQGRVSWVTHRRCGPRPPPAASCMLLRHVLTGVAQILGSGSPQPSRPDGSSCGFSQAEPARMASQRLSSRRWGDRSFW